MQFTLYHIGVESFLVNYCIINSTTEVGFVFVSASLFVCLLDV